MKQTAYKYWICGAVASLRRPKYKTAIISAAVDLSRLWEARGNYHMV